MCTQPIKIKNPKLKAELSTFDAEKDPLYITVPCGRCNECCKQQQNEWIIRLANEYKYTKERNGYVIFETLTYDEKHIPHLFGQYAFSKNHYKTFMKKLRTYLDRHFTSKIPDIAANIYTPSICHDKNSKLNNNEEKILYKEIEEMYPQYAPANNVKVFWVSEYGGEFGRPHYHALFFVTMKITPYEFREYIRKAWIYGFTDKRLIQKQIIQGYEGIYYVAKYVNKTTEEYLQNYCKNKDTHARFKQMYYSIYGEEIDFNTFIKAPIFHIRNVLKRLDLEETMPFIRVSRGMGLEGIKKITKEEWQEGTIKKICKNKGYVLIKIPEYYKRKYMYDYDKLSNTFSLNDKGKLLKEEWNKNRLTEIINEIPIIMEQYAEDYQTTLEEHQINYEYFKKIWEDYKKKNGIMKFANLLVIRGIKANEQIYNDYIKGGNQWKHIYITAATRTKYNISPYFNNLSQEANIINHIYEQIQDMQSLYNDKEKYLVQTYDHIKNIVLEERGRYLKNKQIEAERQKQIKNKLNPNVT